MRNSKPDYLGAGLLAVAFALYAAAYLNIDREPRQEASDPIINISFEDAFSVLTR